MCTLSWRWRTPMATKVSNFALMTLPADRFLVFILHPKVSTSGLRLGVLWAHLAPGLDLGWQREGEALAVLCHVAVVDQVQVVPNVHKWVHPQPSPDALDLGSLAPLAAVCELQTPEQLDPLGLLRLRVFPDDHLPAVVLSPELVRPAIHSSSVSRLREANLQDCMLRHATLGAPDGYDAVWNAQHLQHCRKDNAMPGTVGVSAIPDVRGKRHGLVPSALVLGSPDRHPPQLVADAQFHLSPDDKELLDQLQPLEAPSEPSWDVALAHIPGKAPSP
mmetsp:Transcript_110660/g.308313  ORF Transcript_110660/g.308313 Transcript_110660/m.308313 type:complete len:276 (-) Transcript_110660:226-1053(-)